MMMNLFSLFGQDEAARPPRGGSWWSQLGMARWVLALFLIYTFAPRVLAIYTEALWFDSLKYSAVFWYEFRLKFVLFVVFFSLTLVILRGVFRLFERVFEPYALSGSVVRLEGNPIHIEPEKFMRPLGWAIAILWSFLIASTMTSRWSLWALYLNQVPVADTDPIFNKPLNFYLFSWPILQAVATWLFGLTVILFLVAAAWAGMTYIAKLPRSAQERAQRAAFLATAFTLAAVLLISAVRLYLTRFSLLWKGDDIYNGIGYVGAHITLPAQILMMGVLVLCSLLAIWNAVGKRSLKVFCACIIVPIGVSVASGLVANYVSNFIVKPNQLARETPFIKHNIAATRKAFALDRIAPRDFAAEGNVQAIQAGVRGDGKKKAVGTLDNIRLWDWRALQATLTQTQTLRGYYEFPDVDVDRYVINGRMRQVMIAARELDTSRLPANSRNWVNERLIYTHGYGIVMNTASEFTPEGRPRFIVSEMPLRSTAPEINITRPEIYFGQETQGHVYVKTTQKEFNFVRGGEDSYSSYEGNGDIALGTGLRRWALALSLGDITKIPFSNAITSETRVLLHRRIEERAGRLAPFLQFDNDPYIVVGKNGRLYWMMDAYTTSLYYPYATHYQLDKTWANYARNSVKVVIDAYEGTTDFYVFEKEDPVIRAWRNIYPSLFKDAEKMPADLREHVRYPEALFRTQSEVYGLYHTDDVSAFFARNDLWSVARLEDSSTPAAASFTPPPMQRPGVPGPMSAPQTPGVSELMFNNRNDGTIEPYFLLTSLPGEDTGEEFLLSVPFTPNGRPLNLSGWLAARSDGKNYGQLALYNIAESRNISAPQQILSTITTDSELAPMINLWNQQKSNVLWGNLLVIPVGRGLLYVQPIFLQSTTSPLPVLRMVVLAIQDKIFYAPTYEEALKKLLGEDAELLTSALTGTPAPTGTRPAPVNPSANRKQLIDQAARDLTDYQTLTSQGKYGEAGQKLESLKKNLEKLKNTP